MVTIFANATNNNTPVLQISGGLKYQYFRDRAFTINERESGSEYCEVVTIFANSIKNNMAVQQFSCRIEMPVPLRER